MLRSCWRADAFMQLCAFIRLGALWPVSGLRTCVQAFCCSCQQAELSIQLGDTVRGRFGWLAGFGNGSFSLRLHALCSGTPC